MSKRVQTGIKILGKNEDKKEDGNRNKSKKVCGGRNKNANKDGSGIENDNLNEHEERNKKTRIQRFQS